VTGNLQAWIPTGELFVMLFSPEVVFATVKVAKEIINPEDIYVMDNSAVNTFSRLILF